MVAPRTSTSSLSSREIQTIFKLGKRAVRSNDFDVIIHPSLLHVGRLLVVTSRKIGSAPWRNKARRRLKAIFAQGAFEQLRLDCVIIMKKPGLALDYHELEQRIRTLFAKYS